MDMKSAFHLTPLAPTEFPPMGIQIGINFFMDAFLAMVVQPAVPFFQKFSDAVVFLIQRHAGIEPIINYLDDFLGITSSHQMGTQGMAQTAWLGMEVGIPWVPEKQEGPSQVLVFLETELDCIKLEARLPMENIDKAVQLIKSMPRNRRATVKRIESPRGYLNYCAEIIPAGRAFLRSLSKLVHHTSSGWVPLSQEVILDLQTWLTFLHDFNERTMFVRSRWSHLEVIHMTSDSSGSRGCAAIFKEQCFAMEWSEQIPRINLALLEFYTIVLAIFIWAESMTDKRLTINCDNLATVLIINKLKSTDNTIMKLVQIFALQCLRFNI